MTDPSGAVVPGATIAISNPVSDYTRTTKSDSAGNFSFPNVPLNPYHLTVNLAGIAPYVQDVDVRSSVPLTVKITLQISASAENVTVQAASRLPVEYADTARSRIPK